MRTNGKSKLTILLVTLMVLVAGSLMLGSTFATQVKLEGEATAVDNDTEFNITVLNRTGDAKATTLSKSGALLTDEVAWCPGRTEILYLEFTNDELFPVLCSFNMNVSNSEFDNVFTYAVYEGNLKADGAVHPANWKAFQDDAAIKGQGVMTNNSTLPVFTREQLDPGETYYIALGIHMDENASSIYQNKHMDLTFSMQVDADYKPGDDPTKQ